MPTTAYSVVLGYCVSAKALESTPEWKAYRAGNAGDEPPAHEWGVGEADENSSFAIKLAGLWWPVYLGDDDTNALGDGEYIVGVLTLSDCGVEGAGLVSSKIPLEKLASANKILGKALTDEGFEPSEYRTWLIYEYI